MLTHVHVHTLCRRPITSVADSVKKFSGAGTTEVKRTPVPAKPKQSSPAHVKPDDKHSPGMYIGNGKYTVQRERAMYHGNDCHHQFVFIAK